METEAEKDKQISPLININGFLKDHQSKVIEKIQVAAVDTIKAKIIDATPQGLEHAANEIRSGRLVSFPTETVYGLGADATNEAAVLSIYTAKNRPLTDPVICHVSSVAQGETLLELSDDERELFRLLGTKFWPGPMTIVLKANLSVVPMMVTAQTGWVGVRCPKHKLALQLIEKAAKPIAAPSANLFSHVSPTTPFHVFNDLYDKDLSILFGDQATFGIESTVIKIVLDSRKIIVLRRGSLSYSDIKTFLNTQDKFKDIEVEPLIKKRAVAETQNTEAPGQFLKHYSPAIETYLVRDLVPGMPILDGADITLSDCVYIDIGKRHEAKVSRYVIEYLTLSEKEDVKDAMFSLYDILRYAENIKTAKYILIVDLDQLLDRAQSDAPDFLEALSDKIFRSASGKALALDHTSQKLYHCPQ